jgi:hypothetical protein
MAFGIPPPKNSAGPWISGDPASDRIGLGDDVLDPFPELAVFACVNEVGASIDCAVIEGFATGLAPNVAAEDALVAAVVAPPEARLLSVELMLMS